MSVRYPRLSGLAHDSHPWHYVLEKDDPLPADDSPGRRLAPHYVTLPDKRKIPKWGPTKRGEVYGFRPAVDCNGNFMSYKFQPNNNCYNYACNIATNSFAQPGRLHGRALRPKGTTLQAGELIAAAQADGLILVGHKPMSLTAALKSVTLEARRTVKGGHLVAVLLSKARGEIRWKGDYHFVRCDHPSGRRWSQKDGPDQVTTFDFHGNWIFDPSKANWTVNIGPPPTGWGRRKNKLSAKVVTYEFEAWMFVPSGKVSII